MSLAISYLITMFTLVLPLYIIMYAEVVAVSVIGGAVVGATVFLILVVALIVTALVLFHRKKSSSSHEIHLHGHNLTISLK